LILERTHSRNGIEDGGTLTDLATYELTDNVATITLDDGKVNALSLNMLAGINAALDRAEAAKSAVVILGREGRFSGGFDLTVFRSGDPADGIRLLREGFTLAERLLSFPTPVVIGCTGHAIAMGVFLLLSVDYRIGAEGAFKLQANESAIGMPLPEAAYVISRDRLAPAHVHRALALAEVYAPGDTAIAAGFLDRVVPAGDVAREARATAAALMTLAIPAHTANKLHGRERTLTALRAAINAEFPV